MQKAAIDSNLGVESGLEFILNHFKEPLWPRKVSTAATNRGQHTVFDKGHAMTYFDGALGLDCRISAFGISQTTPDVLFVDMDACNFATMRAFKMALTHTLKRIEQKLNGHPTVIWSGRGYHVIQPIDCTVNLDEVKEFAALTDKPNDKLLQFAERYLTGNRQDSGHHPALRSCMLRVPNSLNARCKEAGIVDPEVKIIQKWDGFRPDYRLLIGSFYADLVGKNQQRYREAQQSSLRLAKNEWCSFSQQQQQKDYGPIDWIDRLLETAITDYRKSARDLILVPYLIVRRGITDESQICDTIMQWADKCAELRRLEPSRREFERRIQSRIYEVMQSTIPSMRFDTLKEKNLDLYKRLSVSGCA